MRIVVADLLRGCSGDRDAVIGKALCHDGVCADGDVVSDRYLTDYG